jgi:hypothetical protein
MDEQNVDLNGHIQIVNISNKKKTSSPRKGKKGPAIRYKQEETIHLR